jgi:peptide chain release factor 2
MKMLKARLYEHEMKKREKEIEDKNAQKTDIGWGHQIRSYVLHPYKMVKDHRTDYEKTDTEAVLDGELDGFMYEMLKKSAIER